MKRNIIQVSCVVVSLILKQGKARLNVRAEEREGLYRGSALS